MLAELCNTSERYLRDLEAGRKNNPSAALVFQFSDILDVPMHELMQKKKIEHHFLKPDYLK